MYIIFDVFSIVFFLMALLRLPIALLSYHLSFLLFLHDLPVTFICFARGVILCCLCFVLILFSFFLHCLLLFSYGFPWIFLWLPVPFAFLLLSLVIALFSLLYMWYPLLLFVFVVFLFLSHGFVLLRFSLVPLWLYLALLFGFLWFSWGPLRKTKAKPGKIGNKRKSMEKHGFPRSSDH